MEDKNRNTDSDLLEVLIEDDGHLNWVWHSEMYERIMDSNNEDLAEELRLIQVKFTEVIIKLQER